MFRTVTHFDFILINNENAIGVFNTIRAQKKNNAVFIIVT